MTRFELFIAGRYLRARRKEAVISVITLISVLGVAAGVKYAKDGKRQSGYTDTGVDLVVAKAAAGVKSFASCATARSASSRRSSVPRGRERRNAWRRCSGCSVGNRVAPASGMPAAWT